MAAGAATNENRKLAAILAADVVGFSRLVGADEDLTLARLRALRSDLIDPAIAANKGRVVKRTGDGVIAEFRSVVDAVRCAIELQHAMVERNGGVPDESAHRLSHRRPPRRRCRGDRRRPDGRRGQHRRTARRCRRGRRRVHFRRGPRTATR
jgi:class 3 adenylate cyclase